MTKRSDDGWTDSQRLALFLEKIDQLVDRRFVRAGALAAEFHLRWRRGEWLEVTRGNVDDDDRRAFLLDLRQFLSNDEPVFVERVFIIIWQLVGDPLRKQLTDARSHWRTAQRTGPMGFAVNGKPVSPQTVLDWWMNGIYFHNDKRKKQALESIGPFGRLLSEEVLTIIFGDAVNYISALGNVVYIARSEGLLPD